MTNIYSPRIESTTRQGTEIIVVFLCRFIRLLTPWGKDGFLRLWSDLRAKNLHEHQTQCFKILESIPTLTTAPLDLRT